LVSIANAHVHILAEGSTINAILFATRLSGGTVRHVVGIWRSSVCLASAVDPSTVVILVAPIRHGQAGAHSVGVASNWRSSEVSIVVLDKLRRQPPSRLGIVHASRSGDALLFTLKACAVSLRFVDARVEPPLAEGIGRAGSLAGVRLALGAGGSEGGGEDAAEDSEGDKDD